MVATKDSAAPHEQGQFVAIKFWMTVFILVMALVVTGTAAAEMYLKNRSFLMNGIFTEGVIIRKGEGRRHARFFIYAYQVNGVVYEGRAGTNREWYAQIVLGETPVKLRYLPDNPAKSLSNTQFRNNETLMYAGLIGFGIMLLFCSIAVIVFIKRKLAGRGDHMAIFEKSEKI